MFFKYFYYGWFKDIYFKLLNVGLGRGVYNEILLVLVFYWLSVYMFWECIGFYVYNYCLINVMCFLVFVFFFVYI